MLRTKLLTLLVIALLASLSAGVSWGATASTATLLVTYFTNASNGGVSTGYVDGTVNIINPGSAAYANVCANIYVFYPDEEIAECCSCTVTPDGLLTLSINNDLTANLLTSTPIPAGVIKVVGGTGTCNATKLTPTSAPSLAAWGTHVLSTGVTETTFVESTLSAGEESALEAQCSDIVGAGSGHGICSCYNSVE